MMTTRKDLTPFSSHSRNLILTVLSAYFSFTFCSFTAVVSLLYDIACCDVLNF